MKRIALALMLVSLLGCAPQPCPEDHSPRGKEILIARPSPEALWTPAVRGGGLVFLTGQLGRDPETRELMPGGIQPETRQCLENIRALLRQIDLDLEDVVKCTVFLADIEDYAPMNEVYRTYFSEDPPARSAFAASALALGARVEIECIAAVR